MYLCVCAALKACARFIRSKAADEILPSEQRALTDTQFSLTHTHDDTHSPLHSSLPVCVCVFCQQRADLNKQKMSNIKEKMERGAAKKVSVRLSGDAH